MSSLTVEFVSESVENLDRADQDFIALEKAPGDREILARIFRAIHTLKGSCGFLGFSRLEALAHSAESLLGMLRSGTLVLTPAITTALLQTMDVIRASIRVIEATGGESDTNYDALIARLDALKQGREEPVVPVPLGALKSQEPAAPLPIEAAVPAALPVEPELPAEPSLPAETSLPERLGDDGALRRGAAADSKIRVNVQLLDSLMNQVGELVLARNQVLQSLASRDGRVPVRLAQRLSQITTDLQTSIMHTRLQPMEIIWNRFPRTVRDLAMELGKRVDLVLEGADTELDRSLLEAIRDPLTHLVRNAIDHGIEPAAERIASGKPPTGTLSLRAWHEGGQVNIEVVDDGRGIDGALVERKARERGLITPEKARTMSHQEKIALIFLPGFSTVSKITSVSGRGVGMDVVKHNIDQVNGAIDIQTEVGRGTSIRLKIPLTLAIVPALIVASSGERYVIPQVSLLAVVSLAAEHSARGIEHVHDAAVFRWRGRLLPLVDLRATLGYGPTPLSGDAVTVVVLQAAERRFGLMVDAVVDSAEVVVKPVNRVIARTRVFAAATIMGDGRAAMILDVLGLAQRAAVVTGHAEQAPHAPAVKDEKAPAAVESQQALIVRVGKELAVVPVTSAIRLEHFPAKSVEFLGRRPVTQYRGRMLPLWQLGGTDLQAGDPDTVLNVVVYTEESQSLGLVVDELVDIIQRPKEIQNFADRRSGVIGGAIVLNRVAQVLDLPTLLREASA